MDERTPKKQLGRIDELLEEIDDNLVAILQEVVRSEPSAGQHPFISTLLSDEDLFTLPRIRAFPRRANKNSSQRKGA